MAKVGLRSLGAEWWWWQANHQHQLECFKALFGSLECAVWIGGMNITIPPERISSLCRMQLKHLPRPKVFSDARGGHALERENRGEHTRNSIKARSILLNWFAPSSASQPLLIFRLPHQPSAYRVLCGPSWMEQHRQSSLVSWEWSKVAARGLSVIVPRWRRETRLGGRNNKIKNGRN